MKKYTSFILFTLAAIIISMNANSQETKPTLTKEEQTLLKLETNVKKAQDKVDKAQAKLASADSLINSSVELEKEANANLDIIEAEEAAFTKDMTTQMKDLDKTRKKATEDELKAIDKEMKALDTKNKLGLKEFEKRAAVENKKLLTVDNNMKKASEKQKQYKPILKDAQAALEDATKKLEEFQTKEE